MSSVGKFFLEFLTPFFKGFVNIFVELFKNILQMFNVLNYVDIIKKYSDAEVIFQGKGSHLEELRFEYNLLKELNK